mgnify:CR=1 FL=1
MDNYELLMEYKRKTSQSAKSLEGSVCTNQYSPFFYGRQISGSCILQKLQYLFHPIHINPTSESCSQHETLVYRISAPSGIWNSCSFTWKRFV